MNTATLRSLAVAALLCAGSSLAYAQTANVTFQVDMNVAIDNCAFIPGTHQVSVPGSFNDWNTGADFLSDDNEDGIYTTTLEIPHGNIAYKFYGSGPLGWEDGDDWTAEIDGDVTFDPVAFRWNVADFCQAQSFDITFTVDMSIQVLAGNFDPDVDRVFVAGGPFGDWAATLDENELFLDVFNEDPWIYTSVLTADLAIPSTNEYKFTKLFGGTMDVGWESIDNRQFSVDGTEPGNELEIPTAYWDNVGPDDIMTEETQARFVVDLRPAFYYVMDNGELPFDVQTGEGSGQSVESLFINGPLPSFSIEDTFTDWLDWGPEALGQFPTRQFHDDGTNGDQTAGDSLYTRMYTFPAGTARTMVAKHGVNAYDNEAGFAVNQNIHVEKSARGAVTDVAVIFGCMRRGDGTFTAHFVDDPDHPNAFAYQPYLVINNNVTPATCEVVRSGGHTVSAEPTGQEPNGLRLFANYPNPVASSTMIEYSLPVASQVRLEVFDLMGRRVALLVDDMQHADVYRVRFDASDLANGSYIFRLVAGDAVQSQRMTVVR